MDMTVKTPFSLDAFQMLKPGTCYWEKSLQVLPPLYVLVRKNRNFSKEEIEDPLLFSDATKTICVFKQKQ